MKAFMGRLTWSTGLDMLSPCRGCSPPPPPPAPSLSARRKSMLAVRGDPSGPPRSPRPTSHPGVAPVREEEGAGGPAPGRAAPLAALLSPAKRSGKSSPGRDNFSAVSPPHGGSLPFAFFFVLPLQLRSLANSPQVAATGQRSPGPRSFLC